MQFIEQPTNLIHVKSDLIAMALIKIDTDIEEGTKVTQKKEFADSLLNSSLFDLYLNPKSIKFRYSCNHPLYHMSLLSIRINDYLNMVYSIV